MDKKNYDRLLYLLVAAIAFMLLLITHQSRVIRKNEKLDMVHRRNIETLLTKSEMLEADNDILAAKVNELELKKKDFEYLLTEDAKQIEKLIRRNDELDRYIKTQLQSEYRIETIIRDSIVYRDRQIDTIRRIEWKDEPWLSLVGEVRKDSLFIAEVHHSDMVDVAVILEWNRFLWFKTSIRNSRVVVTSRNPYVTSIDVMSVKIDN